MKGLIIDTSLKNAYAAAFDGEKESVVYFDSSLSTSSGITRAVRDALSALSLSKRELDGVAAVVGPGTFTGIRIGVSFANAFCSALSIPRFRLTSFVVMRAAKPSAPCYAIDAGHSSAYAAFPFEGTMKEVNADISSLPEGTVFQKDVESDLPRGAIIAARVALEELSSSPCAPVYLTDSLKPHYMKLSQAERLLAEKK